MKAAKLTAIIAGVAVVFSTGYAIGQQTAPDEAALKQLGHDIAASEAELTGMLGNDRWAGARKASGVYSKAVGNSDYTRAVVEQALVGQYSGDRNNEALAKLTALQVMQNQRIIELLEKDARK
jgi:hypothetical protein